MFGESNFDLLLSFPNICIMPYLLMVYWLSLCCHIFLHSGDGDMKVKGSNLLLLVDLKDLLEKYSQKILLVIL
jgi:hypothetical protein